MLKVKGETWTVGYESQRPLGGAEASYAFTRRRKSMSCSWPSLCQGNSSQLAHMKTHSSIYTSTSSSFTAHTHTLFFHNMHAHPHFLLPSHSPMTSISQGYHRTQPLTINPSLLNLIFISPSQYLIFIAPKAPSTHITRQDHVKEHLSDPPYI